MNKPKFRAWDTVNKKMISWNRLLNGHNLRNVFKRPEMCGLILMQYTGLKDKNGVEIYEGDIIKGPHDFGPAGFHQRAGVVTFTAEHGYQWEYWLIDDIEVIGSIHENPELLSGVE